MIKAYKSYTNSGIHWVGDIPANWSKVKIGRSFDLIASGTTPKSGSRVYYSEGTINWLNTGDLNDSYITKTKKKITQKALEDFSTLKLYPEESIVIALYGATIGKLGHLKIKTTTNQACCVLSNSKLINNGFLFYFLLYSREHIISMAYGGGQPNISQDTIKQLYLPKPPLQVQTQIAKYLDYQTNIIDQLIEKKEKLVTLLQEQRQAIINEAVTKGLDPNAKVKDSGIEWLGEIPEAWEIYSLKHFCSQMISGPFGSSLKKEFYVKSGYKIYGQEQVIKNDFSYGDYYIDENRFQQLRRCEISTGDVLISCVGTFGKIALVPKNFEKGIINPRLVKITPDSQKVIPKFLLILLRSKLKYSQLESFNRGGVMGVINLGILSKLKFPISSLLEQNKIIDHIDSMTHYIDLSLEKIVLQIQKLKEYRQSIISEAVTGKIDLREWEAPKSAIA